MSHMLLHEALALRPKEIIAAVGAGGKTTILARLADELTARGCCVVSTTTTHMWQPSGLCIVEEDEAVLAAKVADLAAPGKLLTVASGRSFVPDMPGAPPRAKLTGVPSHVPGLLARLAAIDHVLVEADGARGRAVKAPAPHEPVIPPGATVVLAVVSIEAVGQPLNGELAHRPEYLATLLHIEPGTPLSPQHIATLLEHPQGGRKAIPPSARYMPFVNKVEDTASLAAAHAIAEHLRGRPGINRVLIGAALKASQPVTEVWR